MKLINLRVICTFLMLLSLSSCGLFGGNERPVYQGAEYYKNLEVPPDLTEPDTSAELRVAEPTEEALQRFRDNNKLETVITPKFDGVRMVTYAGNSWIEVDNDVEHVWSRLLEFWESEGTKLVEVRPLLGFMETDWVERLDAEAGFFSSMFQKFEPDQKDKFRVRVESFGNNQKTRIYLAHTRIERVVLGEYADEFVWQTRPSDLEAEREILSRMAIFAGLNNEGTLQLLENYRPYSSLVKIDSANTTALSMTGSMDFVWRRAMRALDRMRMADIREQKESSSIHFVVARMSPEELHVEQDKLSESSWIMQLFTDDSEKDPATDIDRQYRLDFSETNGRIQIQVVDARDSQATDEDGDVSGTALAEQLRNVLAEKLE